MYLLPQDFETERLYIEYHSEENWRQWLPFFMDDAHIQYLGLDLQSPKDVLCLSWSKRQRSRYEEGHGAVLFKTKDKDDYVGNSGLIIKEIDDERITEIGYSLMPQHKGKGYAIEMAKAIRDYGFSKTDVPRLYSTIDPRNMASNRVAEKNGMSPGRMTKVQGYDIRMWSISRKEWEALR